MMNFRNLRLTQKRKGSMDKSKDKGGQVSGKKMAHNPGASSSKLVRRSLEFLEEVGGFNLDQASCVDLLKAMELDDEEEEVSVQGDKLYEDDEMCHLPTEWVDILSTNKNTHEASEVLHRDLDGGSMGLECSQEEEEGSQNTQPTTEDLAKSSVQEGAGVKTKKLRNNGVLSWLRGKVRGFLRIVEQC
jgi:hypothetical protein